MIELYGVYNIWFKGKQEPNKDLKDTKKELVGYCTYENVKVV